MKKITTTILTSGMLLAGLVGAVATPTMRLSADGGVTWTVVTDNGPLDSDPTDGFVTYQGPVGDWVVSVASGIGAPVIGTPASPKMDLNGTDVSSGPDTLIVQMSDVNFTPSDNQTFIAKIGVSTDGTVTYNTYRDTGNVLFGSTAAYPADPASPSLTAAALLTQGPFSGGTYFASNSVAVPLGGVNPYSLTLETVIVHSGAGQETSSDASLTSSAPPPCSCTLTFISPLYITNCAGDKIPDVIAIQNCGGGLSNVVQTTFVGASTNGTCPKIITRTNSATDNCGNVQTFVQTITVNCKGNICGHVFADCDGSGDLTKGDVGLSKVTVSLLDSNNHIIGTQVTDAGGGYCFTNLAGGNYTVSVTPPTGYSQTAATTSYHWKDTYGRTCWGENDGYIHCLSSGTECWWDKTGCSHWKDSYGRDCWKDNWGGSHCQPCSYQSCNAQTYNSKITVCLTNCTSLTDVDFAYTGTKACVSVCVSGPSYVKCGQSYTYTCTVTNTGNVCFTGGTVCHTIGNCSGWGWNNCNNYTYNCPPLSPGQHCTFTQKCTFSSKNCGTVGCYSTVNCNQHGGSTSGNDSCYSQCGY